MKKNWVIKIGSSLVTKGNTGLDNKNIKNWTKQINELVKNNACYSIGNVNFL